MRETVRVAIERVRRGLPTKSTLMVGLRGVGKTVLLDRMREDAETAGIQTLRVEAPESRSLPGILAPQLRQALLRLSRNEHAKDFAQRALRGLAGFAKALHEMIHRYIAGILLLLILALAVLSYRNRRDPAQPKLLPWVLVLAVGFQAALGAFTVTKLNDVWLKRIFLTTVLILAVKTILDFGF